MFYQKYFFYLGVLSTLSNKKELIIFIHFFLSIDNGPTIFMISLVKYYYSMQSMNIRPNEHIEIRLHRSKDFFFKRINVNVGLLESQEYANSFLTVWHSTFRAHKKSIPAVPSQSTFFLCCKTWDLNFSILRKSFIREKFLSEQLIDIFSGLQV